MMNVIIVMLCLTIINSVANVVNDRSIFKVIVMYCNLMPIDINMIQVTTKSISKAEKGTNFVSGSTRWYTKLVLVRGLLISLVTCSQGLLKKSKARSSMLLL